MQALIDLLAVYTAGRHAVHGDPVGATISDSPIAQMCTVALAQANA